MYAFSCALKNEKIVVRYFRLHTVHYLRDCLWEHLARKVAAKLNGNTCMHYDIDSLENSFVFNIQQRTKYVYITHSIFPYEAAQNQPLCLQFWKSTALHN